LDVLIKENEELKRRNQQLESHSKQLHDSMALIQANNTQANKVRSCLFD